MGTHGLCLILVSFLQKHADSRYSLEPPDGGNGRIGVVQTCPSLFIVAL